MSEFEKEILKTLQEISESLKTIATRVDPDYKDKFPGKMLPVQKRTARLELPQSKK